MRSKIIISGVILLVVMSMKAAFAANPNYTFIVPLEKGISDTSFGKMLGDMTTVVSKETGVNLTMTRPSFELCDNPTDIVLKALKDNKAQMGLVYALEYLDAGAKASIFRPDFTLTFDNKKNSEVCMYVSRDSAVTSVKETRGLVWAGYGSDFYGMKLILHENGIDEPAAKFFKQVKFMSSSPTSNYLQALAKGDIGVFVTSKEMLKMGAKVLNEPGQASSAKQGPVFKEIYCTPFTAHWILGYRKDVPEEIGSKITKSMTTAHKNQAYRQFQFLFVAIKGHFVPLAPGDLKRTAEIKKLKDSLGWDKEMVDLKKKCKASY
ncbi:MAG TPA: PhnD/SsuA/transferrin family substrate-binding protein [bacterium]|nr:PhnD/SsuA/transferrin family substrate-binding protein [bacterium]